MHIARHEIDAELQTPGGLSPAAGTVLLVHRNLDDGKLVFGCLQDAGLDVIFAETSRRAIEILSTQAATIDVVLLDVGTAVSEGYNLAETVRCTPDYRAISIATLSAHATHTVRIYATAGCVPTYDFAYPVDQRALVAGMREAVADTRRKRQLEVHVAGAAGSFDILESCRFKLRTPEDVERAAYMAAACFPQPARAIHGLEELLMNAIEHGNLELGHETKLDLLKSGQWVSEIEKRLASETYGRRMVDFAVVKRDGGTSAVITDQGPGFDWKSVLNGNGAAAQGRGISRARLISFDKLVYNDAGNRVVAFMNDTGALDW